MQNMCMTQWPDPEHVCTTLGGGEDDHVCVRHVDHEGAHQCPCGATYEDD